MGLLQMSISGAVLILSVIVIRTAAIHRLPKKTFLILWWIAILRLLMPLSIPSAFSVYSLIGQNALAIHSGKTPIDSLITAMQGEALDLTGEMPAVPAVHISMWFVIWTAGMAFGIVFFAVSYLRCRFEFSTSLPVQNDFSEKWLKEHRRMRRISIRQSSRIKAPLTYGIFKPVILVPQTTDWKNRKQLQYILLHEYVHICRFDAAAKLISALTLCIHWFNPMVWAMYILFNRDMELACDESVVRYFGTRFKKDYGLMLINMEAENSGLMPFCSSFGKNAMEERITAIMKTKQTAFASSMTACLLIWIVINVFATSGTVLPESRENTASSVSSKQTRQEKNAANSGSSMTIIHESVELLYYENGWPYLHDILTNHTDKTITDTEYCMLAYDENGAPLKLYWNMFDTSQEKSYDYLVQIDGLNLKPGQTENYHGGWSLYDGEVMDEWPMIGNGEPNPAVYSLFCLKQVGFEDGTIWNNPDYANWFERYAGKEVKIEELQNYYPYQYEVELK